MFRYFRPRHPLRFAAPGLERPMLYTSSMRNAGVDLATGIGSDPNPRAPARVDFPMTSNSRIERRLPPSAPAKRASTGGAVLEFAVVGGLLAGAFGIFKATQMEHFLDIVLCLFGSVTGCGLVCYLYFRRD